MLTPHYHHAKLEMQFQKSQMIKSMALVALVDNYLEASIQPEAPYSASTDKEEQQIRSHN